MQRLLEGRLGAGLESPGRLRLGFLYKRVQDEPKEAVYHFKQYLLLAPHAKNRKEVEYIIEMLSPQE